MRYSRQVLEIEGWNGSSVVTFRFSSDDSFTTKFTDTPPNTLITARVQDPGLFSYSMFKSNKTHGASSYAVGDVVLNNKDNGLDYLRSYSFDGRTITLYEGSQFAAFPSEFTKVYTATIGSPNFEWDTISFSLRDKQVDLNVRVPSGTFLGDNVAPLGVEGGDDLINKPKPMLLGRAHNISPVLCNSSKLIYAISPATGIASQYMGSKLSVYDKGVKLIFGGTYSSLVDMQNNQPQPGQYKVWESGGYVRLGSLASALTCDVVSYGRSVTAMPGNLISDLLTISGAAFNSSDIAALNLAFRSECGVYLTGSETIAATLDVLCSACGAYWYTDPSGVIRVSQFVDPSTLTPYISLQTDQVGKSVTLKRPSDTANGVPAYAVTLLRSKNYTVQTDLAQSVTPDRRVWLGQAWRKTSKITESIKTDHPLSEELTIETCLAADDQAECTRRFNLYSVSRNILDIEVDIDTFESTSNVKPGLCIEMNLLDVVGEDIDTRYNVSSLHMVVTSYVIDRVGKTISLSMWG